MLNSNLCTLKILRYPKKKGIQIENVIPIQGLWDGIIGG